MIVHIKRSQMKDKKMNDRLAYARFRASIDSDEDYSFDFICRKYVNETKENKELIDLTLISICGYSLETLLYNKDKNFMYEKEAKEYIEVR